MKINKNLFFSSLAISSLISASVVFADSSSKCNSVSKDDGSGRVEQKCEQGTPPSGGEQTPPGGGMPPRPSIPTGGGEDGQMPPGFPTMRPMPSIPTGGGGSSSECKSVAKNDGSGQVEQKCENGTPPNDGGGQTPPGGAPPKPSIPNGGGGNGQPFPTMRPLPSLPTGIGDIDKFRAEIEAYRLLIIGDAEAFMEGVLNKSTTIKIDPELIKGKDIELEVVPAANATVSSVNFSATRSKKETDTSAPFSYRFDTSKLFPKTAAITDDVSGKAPKTARAEIRGCIVYKIAPSGDKKGKIKTLKVCVNK
jgi:hypothetical protein